MDTPLGPRDLWRIFWRRKWLFLLPLGLAITAAIGLIVALPTLYRSEATILIERQDVPENVVPSLVTEQIDRRLQVITQRVLVADNLYRIAERYGLYPEERELLPRNAVAAMMRDNIETESVVTEFNDPQTGRSGEATLAFKIRFAYENPQAARNVTNDLVGAYLSSNLESRRAVADQTTSFLAGEREALDRRIATIEDELADFKTENRELLPDEAAFKRQLLNSLERRLRVLDGDIRVLRERESYLSTQLALIDEFDSPRTGRADTPESRLERLRADLATARARYRPGHPDVVRLEREVASLEGVVGARSGSSPLAERESMLRGELATLRERYTDEHPDVRRVERELAAVRGELNEAGPVMNGAERSNTYVQLSAQLNSVQAEIASVEDQRTELRAEQVELQEQLARAPTVEREYNRIVRRLDNALADRDKLADKEANARLSGSLEATAAGERLTLMQPPSTPSGPFSPNKKLLLALGLVLGVGSGGTLMALAEFFDRSIRSMRDLSRIVGDTPLAAIPVIVVAADRRRRWRRRGAAAAVLLLAVGGTLGWVHQRVVPLDVLGYQATNRAEQWMARTFPDLTTSGLPAAESR